MRHRFRHPLQAYLVVALVVFATQTFAEQVIHRGVGGDPDSLDPHVATGNTGQLVLMDLFEGLYTLDARGKAVLGAAESVTRSDDGITYRFKLRPELRWSDGKPLTAEDFVYSFRRLHDPALASARGALGLDALKNAKDVLAGKVPPEELGVAAENGDVVVLTLGRPLPYLSSILTMTTFLPVPKHVIQEYGNAWVRPEHHVSNGPFRLAEFILKQHTLIERNPYFHAAETVQLERLYFKSVEDPATGLRQFLNGELDIMLGIPRTRLKWIKQNIPDSLRLNPLAGVYFYLFNTTRAPFDDARVRKALSLSVNRDLITGRILVNGERPAYRLVPPANAREPFQSFEPELAMNERLEQARALLAEAGYTDDNPLEFELKFDGSGDNKTIAVALGQMWKSLPVEVSLMSIELGALMGAARRKDFDLLRWLGLAAYDDPTSFIDMLRSTSASNRNGFDDPEFDEAFARANTILDPDERLTLLENAERDALSAHPVLPIYFLVGVRLVKPTIEGWEDHPGAFNLARYLSVR